MEIQQCDTLWNFAIYISLYAHKIQRGFEALSFKEFCKAFPSPFGIRGGIFLKIKVNTIILNVMHELLRY